MGASNWEDVKAFSKDDVKAAAEMASRSGGGTDSLTQLKELKKEFAGSLGSLNKMTRKGENFSLKELSSADTIKSFKDKGGLDKVASFVLQGNAVDLSVVKDENVDATRFSHYVKTVENGASAEDAEIVIETAVLAGETDLDAVAAQSTEQRNSLVEKVKEAKEKGEDVGKVFIDLAREAREAAKLLSDAAKTAFDTAKTSIAEAQTAEAVDVIVSAFNNGHTEEARSGLDLAAYGTTRKDLLAAIAAGNLQAAANAAFTSAKLAINDASTVQEVDTIVSIFDLQFPESGLDLTSDATSRKTAINLANAAVQMLNNSIAATKAEIDGAVDKSTVDAYVTKFRGDNPDEQDAFDEIYTYGVTRKEAITTAELAAAELAAKTAFNTAVNDIKEATTQAQVEQILSEFETAHGDAGGDDYKASDLAIYGQNAIAFLTASEAEKPLIALNLAKNEISKAETNDQVGAIVTDYKEEFGDQSELIAQLDSAAATQYTTIATTAQTEAKTAIDAATKNADVASEVDKFKTEYPNQTELIAELEQVATTKYSTIATNAKTEAETAIASATKNADVASEVDKFKTEYPNQTELIAELEQVATSKYVDIANPHVATAKDQINSAPDSGSIQSVVDTFTSDYPNAGDELTKSVTDAAEKRNSALSAHATAVKNIADALTSDAVEALAASFAADHSSDARKDLDLTEGATARKSAISAFESAKTDISEALTLDAVDTLVSDFNTGPDKDNIAGLDLTTAADGRKSAIVAFDAAKTNIAASRTLDSIDAIVTGFETGPNKDHISGLNLTSDASARKLWIVKWQIEDIVPSVLYANNANSGFGAALEQAVSLADSILKDNSISNSLPSGSIYNASQLTGNGYNYELLRIIAKYGGIGSKSTAADVNIDSIIDYLGGDVSANGQSAFSAVTNALIGGSTSQLQKAEGENTILDTNVLGTNKITIDPGSESLFTIKTSNINASLGANVGIESGANIDVSDYLGKAPNSRERKVLVIGAAKDLTIKGDATFTNANDVEDHALALGAADDVYFRSEYSSANSDAYGDPDPITVKYTGSNMGIGSYDTMRLVNVNLETGGNLALASLDELHITSSRPDDPSTFTVGTGGKNSDPDNVYLYAHNLISVNGLQFGGRVDDVYMEAITIDLENVAFPHNSDVMLRSRDGLPTFGPSAREVGKVNFINNNKYGSTPIESINQFNGTAGHVNSNILLPNGTPAIKIRGFSTPNSNTN